MRAIPSLFAAVFVLLLTMGGRAEAQAPPAEAYPIWWSPSLKLDSLEGIDARLNQPIWRNLEEFRLVVGVGKDRRTEIARSCADIRKLENESSGALDSPDIYVWKTLRDSCVPIEKLREARPAKKSYVNRFKLDSDSLNYLPAMVNISSSCDLLCRQYVANERRISLKEFLELNPSSMSFESDYRMEGEASGTHLTLEILARADFTGDGLEDLLVFAQGSAIGGTWVGTRLDVLTRDTPDGVLWVLDAEKKLCIKRHYQCETEYDFPEALRRTN